MGGVLIVLSDRGTYAALGRPHQSFVLLRSSLWWPLRSSDSSTTTPKFPSSATLD